MVVAGFGGSVGRECEVDQDDRGWGTRSGPVGHLGRARGCARRATRLARLRRYGHLAEAVSVNRALGKTSRTVGSPHRVVRRSADFGCGLLVASSRSPRTVSSIVRLNRPEKAAQQPSTGHLPLRLHQSCRVVRRSEFLVVTQACSTAIDRLSVPPSPDFLNM